MYMIVIGIAIEIRLEALVLFPFVLYTLQFALHIHRSKRVQFAIFTSRQEKNQSNRHDAPACLNVLCRARSENPVRANWVRRDRFVWRTRRVILTELEHASKQSNRAACVEGPREAKGFETRCRQSRMCDEIGRSAPGKRIRCNRPELSSRARELGAA